MTLTAHTILCLVALLLFIIALFPQTAPWPLCAVGGILLSVAMLIA